jgi:ubiquinone/menaquinone biosynthesis C-methylase UbiE
MNISHSGVTDWGLSHVSVAADATILDVGCGGGRTIAKLAATAVRGKVYGVDHAQASVEASTKMNAKAIASGRVEIHSGSVSQLPFPDNTFDLVTAIETHFWWPDLPNDMGEVFRVTKHGGTVLLVAEVYKGAGTEVSRILERRADATGLLMLSSDEHRSLLTGAGFSDVQVFEERTKGWISAVGRK